MSRALVLAAALGLGACSPKPQQSPPASPAKPSPPVAVPDASVPADVTAESYVPPPLPRGKVVLQDAYGGAHVVEVELAATEPARTRGLMWRKDLAPGKGMLFLFPSEQLHSFWMRNTLIALDMIFITKELKIAGVVENATPHSLDSRGVQRATVYVLEVPAGWSAKAGLRAGDGVQIVGAGNVTVQ